MKKLLKLIKDTLFPTYIYLSDRDYRVNASTGVVQGFSCELGKWMDLDYLEGTNYDSGQWCRYRPHIESEIRQIRKGI